MEYLWSDKVVSSSIVLSSRGKLECDMILLYGYFEDYLVKLWRCVPVFNSVVKFIGSFKVFFGVFSHTYSQEISGCILLKYSKK